MSQIITKETVETIITGTKSVTEVVAGVSAELMDEALRLFIFEASLSILKFASVFVVFFIVKRYFDTMLEVADEKNKGFFKALKVSALVSSIIFFTSMSFPHIQTIGKCLVSPKLFLLEKANELRK